jgi:hypothetical protein
MFLLYLDDSGSTNNSNEPYLVLGGVCVSEHQVNDLTDAMERLASKYDGADPDSVEFHASAIYSGKHKPWNAMTRKEDKRQVLKEVLGVFNAAAPPACALGCAVHKASFPGQDPMELAFSELCGWFDGFLKTRHQNTGTDEKGIIFLDESTYETSLRRIARDFRRSGLTTDNGRYIVDGPHFVRSNTTRCVQIADHVAYSVFRYFHALDSNYLNVVLNRFQSDGRVMEGLRHLSADKAACTCPACLTIRSCAGTLLKV